MRTDDLPELHFAAGTILGRPVLERAEAVAAGGFASTSCFVGDVVAWEASGRPLSRLRAEMEARDAPIDALLPILDWHPRWDPARPTGITALRGGTHVGATRADALRWADALGARTITLVGPWGGPDASFGEQVDDLGRFADRAAELGVRLQLEIVPTSKLPDVPTVLALVGAVDGPNLGVLLDTYNLGRAGIDPADLDLLPVERVFGLELADAASTAVPGDYFEDALHHRVPAGEGDLGVEAFVRRLATRGPLPPCSFEVMADAYADVPATELGAFAGAHTRAFLRRCLGDDGVAVPVARFAHAAAEA